MSAAVGTIAAAILLVVLAVSPARAVDLVVQSVFPGDLAFISDGQRRVAADVAALTDGGMSLRIVPAGALARPEDLMEEVRSGRIAAGWDWPGYRADDIPLAGLIGSYPYGPAPTQLAGWLIDGGGLDLLERAYGPLGLTVMPCQMVVAEAAGWFTREIRAPEDFQGLRIRMAGLGAKVLERLGAVPSAEPVGELFDALSGGRLDAVEFSMPLLDQSFGFSRFARYYFFPGWHQPASIHLLMINSAVWDSLPLQHRTAVATACRANMLWSMTTGQRAQIAPLEAFRRSGVEVRRFSYAVLKRLQAVSQEVLAEEAARDPLVAEAVRSIAAYIEGTQRWLSLQHLPP